MLTIRNSDGEVVRRLAGSTSKGMHRANWDLRYAGIGRGGGPLAIPGTYTVDDHRKSVAGETTELVAASEFEIEPLTLCRNERTGSEGDHGICHSKLRNWPLLSAAQLSVATEAKKQLEEIKKVIRNSTDLDPAMENEVRELEIQLLDINENFNGDPTKTKRNESASPGINSRLMTLMFGAMGSTEGPTGTHRRQYEIATELYQEMVGDLRTWSKPRFPNCTRNWTKPVPLGLPGGRFRI